MASYPDVGAGGQPQDSPPAASSEPAASGSRGPLDLRRHRLFLCALFLLLLALVAAGQRPVYLAATNLARAGGFLLSARAAVLALITVILVQKRIRDRAYNFLAFFLAFAWVFVLFGDRVRLFSMYGDNICQVAYWEILFRPNLAGSIGASLTKPGQAVLSGILHEAAALSDPRLFGLGLCLVMAGCVAVMVRIATDIGGRWAGAAAFAVTPWAFGRDFLGGEATIYFIPMLFLGLRLAAYSPRHRSFGFALLALSLQFHIQTVAVIGVIGCALLLGRDWSGAARLCLFSVISLALWVFFIVRVQGTLARFNCGAAAGYPVPATGFAGQYFDNDSIGYVAANLASGLGPGSPLRSLVVVGLIGAVGALYYRRSAYLAVFAILGLLIANVVVLGGTMNRDRYFAFLHAFACSVGIGSMVRYAADMARAGTRELRALAAGVLFVILVPLGICARPQRGGMAGTGWAPPVEDGFRLARDTALPRSARLLTEDDLLYVNVVIDPDRFPRLGALQAFNMAGETERARILAETDMIWIATNNRHLYYYVTHVPVPAWRDDPFRRMVESMIDGEDEGRMYGSRFHVAARDAERLVLEVDRADAGPDS